MAINMIEVTNLTKRFGRFTALEDLSFTFGTGEAGGLRGGNRPRPCAAC